MNGKDIVTWFGLHTLRSKEGTELSTDDFLDLWTASIPVALTDLTPDPLDLSALVGNFVKVSPTRLVYFTKSQLATAPKQRFQQLFGVKATWELAEIVPFLEDIRNKSIKMESFVMKYAKKKTVGKRIYVSPR